MRESGSEGGNKGEEELRQLLWACPEGVYSLWI